MEHNIAEYEGMKLSNIDKHMKYVLKSFETDVNVWSDDLAEIAESINQVSFFTIGYINRILKKSPLLLHTFTGYNQNEIASLIKAFSDNEKISAIENKMKSTYDPTVARQQFSNAEIKSLMGTFTQDVVENYQDFIVYAESTNNGAEASKYVEFNEIRSRQTGEIVGYKTRYYFVNSVTATWYSTDKVYGDIVPTEMFTTLEEFHKSLKERVSDVPQNFEPTFEFSPSKRYVVELSTIIIGADENITINPIIDTKYNVRVGTKETYHPSESVLYLFDDSTTACETFQEFENVTILKTYKIDSDGAEYSESGKLNVEPIGEITNTEGIAKRSIINNSVNLGDEKYIGVCEIDLSTNIRTYIDNAGHSFENINDLERHLITNFNTSNQSSNNRNDDVLETSLSGKLEVVSAFTIDNRGYELRSIVNVETLEVVGQRSDNKSTGYVAYHNETSGDISTLNEFESFIFSTGKSKGRIPTELDILENNLKIANVAKEEADAYLKRYKNNPMADKVTYNKAKLADAKRKIKRYTVEIEKLKPVQNTTENIQTEITGEISETGRLTVKEDFKENDVWNPKGEFPLKEKEQEIIVSETGLIIGNKRTDVNNHVRYYLNSDLGRGFFNLDDLEIKYFQFIDLAIELEKEIFEICENSENLNQALKTASILEYPQEASKIFFRKYYSRENDISSPQEVIEYIFKKVKQ